MWRDAATPPMRVYGTFLLLLFFCDAHVNVLSCMFFLVLVHGRVEPVVTRKDNLLFGWFTFSRARSHSRYRNGARRYALPHTVFYLSPHPRAGGQSSPPK